MPEAIFEDGPVDTPYVYTVSGTGTVTPRACAAVFNGSGAGGAFIPAVIFRSLAGNVIARAILDSTIVAGDDAEVSWFPGVKPQAAVPVAAVLGMEYAYMVSNSASVAAGATTFWSMSGPGGNAPMTNTPAVFTNAAVTGSGFTGQNALKILAPGFYLEWRVFSVNVEDGNTAYKTRLTDKVPFGPGSIGNATFQTGSITTMNLGFQATATAFVVFDALGVRIGLQTRGGIGSGTVTGQVTQLVIRLDDTTNPPFPP